MLAGVAGFEIRYQLRNPVFWVSLFIFFLLGFGLTASENVSIGTPGTVHENAPFAITSATALMSLFYLFVITSFVANAIVRDDVTRFGPMIRATAITKNQLVYGRFLGGFAIAVLGYLAVPLGMASGVMMPWVDAETVGPQSLAYYAWPYLIIAIPNLFMASALLFALATTTRSMMWSYVGVVAFVMGYLIVTTILGSRVEYQQMLALYEPLGFGAISDATRYWTAADMNSKLLPFEGNVLINRMLVLAVGFVLLVGTIWRFSMAERAPSKRALKKLARADAKSVRAAAILPMTGGGLVLPAFGRAAHYAQFMTRLRTEVMQVMKSPGLIILLLLAVINTAAGLWFSQTAYGTPSHPLTASIISNVLDGFVIFLLIVAVFYGGELVWRERDVKFHEIVDATPTPNWVMTIPKILAIFAVLLIMNLSAMATGLLYQLAKGAEHFGIASYFGWFIIPVTIDMALLAVLAVFAQVVSPNKYVGWGIILVWFVGSIFLRNMGYENALYRYGSTPGEPLSDMNGDGGFWVGAAWLRAYWLAFAVLLLVIAHLLWPRGTNVALRPRFAGIGKRLRGMPLVLGVASIAAMAGTGTHIHHNFKTLNRYQTSDDVEKWTADYEKRYLKYENLPRPVVTAVTLDAQIFPKQGRLDVTGNYQLRNNSDAPISQVHVRAGSLDVQFPKLALNGARLVREDKDFGYRIFRFDQPLPPGAETELHFQSQIWNRGFRNGRPATNIALNGTFVNNFEFAPIIGMNRQSALKDRAVRRRQGLPAELRPAKLEDRSATGENYVRTDWVMSDITVTTDADQVPIAPGRKVADATKNGRRTAHFVASAPIHNFLSIQSARYQLTEKNHKGVKLTIYHDPRHGWNVPKMLAALEAGLDYYQASFGPYQFDHARIIEFPGYASFAQAFAGTMPYSESVGFAADVSDPDSIDYVTYITAHELGHQYWAHQEIGADMQGNTVTTETLAQYSALMVMKKLYGRDKIRRFLKYELDQYLAGRKGEAIEELPLIRVEDQPYIHYRKGSLIMYLLQERLGEDAVNRALARFIQTWKFKGAPYHRSLDLIVELRNEAKTAEDQALITDLFERITIYDLKASEARSVKTPGGNWKTSITVEAKKYYANGKGVEKEAPLAEPIEVGLFTGRPGIGAFGSKDVISITRQPVKGGRQVIVITSARKPAFAGIDPYNFYIDRNSDDNVIEVLQ
jgi:ABC-2 type transport system permease protein